MSIKATEFVKLLKPGWGMAANRNGRWTAFKYEPKLGNNAWFPFRPSRHPCCSLEAFDIEKPENWEESWIRNGERYYFNKKKEQAMSIKATDFVKFLKPGWWMAYQPCSYEEYPRWRAFSKEPIKKNDSWIPATASTSDINSGKSLQYFHDLYGIDVDPPDNWETSLIQNKPLEHDFKVGDLVNIYYGLTSFPGKIIGMKNEDLLEIDSVYTSGPGFFHYKTCRKLVMKDGVEVEEE